MKWTHNKITSSNNTKGRDRGREITRFTIVCYKERGFTGNFHKISIDKFILILNLQEYEHIA